MNLPALPGWRELNTQKLGKMNKKLFIIVGHGRLAEAIAGQVMRRGFRFISFEESERSGREYDPRKTVLVHVGKGDQLNLAIDSCQRRDLILLQGSRNLKSVPSRPSCVVVNSSIFALGALQYIEDVIAKAESRKSTGLTTSRLIERRHPTDDWASGVTSLIAGKLGLAKENISLETDDDVRRQAGVPDEHLLEHVYYRAEFNGIAGIEGLDFTIPSHQVYADGAIDLGIQAMSVHKHLGRGNHSTWQVLSLAGELNSKPDPEMEELVSGNINGGGSESSA